MSEPNTTLADKGVGAMTKAEVKLGNTGLQLRNIDELFRFAQAVAGSALAPKDFIGKPESVLVAIQMGMEIGLPPMAALQNIAVINGRPSVWGDAQLAVVRSSGELEAFEEAETNNEIEPLFRELCFEDDVQKRKAMKIKIAVMQSTLKKDADDYGVTCFVRRAGFNEAFSRFTVADAKTAGLWRKQGPWTNYPSRMLKARARSFLLRDQFGDALKGMMSREEAGDTIDITAIPHDVPRAEALPGPTPFRRAVAPAKTPAPEPVKEPEQAPVVETPPPDSTEPSQPEQKPIEVVAKVEPAPAPAAAASATQPPQEPAEIQPTVEIPPSKLPADWPTALNSTDAPGTLAQVTEWLAAEEIHLDEFINYLQHRTPPLMKKEQKKLSELATMKLVSILKAREAIRVDVLKQRPQP